MPSYKENLEHANRILEEINKRSIVTPENLQRIPAEVIWAKINYIRDKVSKKTEKDKALLLPGLTSAISTAALQVGACQELAQLALLLYLASNRSDIALISAGNDTQIKSGNIHADNHMFVMIGPVFYKEKMVYTKNSNPSYIPTLETFFKNQPETVVLLDPLLNFVGRPADCPKLTQYCDSHNIKDILGVVPYQNTLTEIELPISKIVEIVQENADRIAKEIDDELTQTILQGARQNKPATEMLPLLFKKPIFTVDDIIDPKKMNLLHYACLYGNEVLVNYYLSVSPKLMALANNDGRTPLDFLGAGQSTIKETLLLAGVNPSDQDIKEIVANVERLKIFLFTKREYHSDWLLRKAASDGDARTVKYLANLKPESINSAGPSGATALHQAAKQGRVDICSFLTTIKGINIDAEDKDGNTPFLLAIKNKHFHLVSLFVKARAAINKTNAAEESARSLLVSLGQENLLVVDSEPSADIVSAAKNLLHFSPAKPSEPAAKAATPEVKF